MNIIKVILENGNSTQPFLRFTYTNQSKTKLHRIHIKKSLVDHTPSLVAVSNENNLVLKLIKPRRSLEIAKLLTGRSRLSKEVRGALLLKKHGFKTPTIHEVGYGLFPTKPFQFLGYYLMDNLDNLGFTEVFKLYQSTNLDKALREKSYCNIIGGLRYLRDHHIGLFDFTLGNVFANDSGEIMWIDTGTSLYRKATPKFKLKYNHSIERFIRIHKDLLNDQEVTLARQLLFK